MASRETRSRWLGVLFFGCHIHTEREKFMSSKGASALSTMTRLYSDRKRAYSILPPLAGIASGLEWNMIY